MSNSCFIFDQRIERLRKKLYEQKVEALFVNHLTHVRYLSGFTGSAGSMLITENKSYFFSDGRYEEQAHNEVKHCDIHIVGYGYLDTIKKTCFT